LDYKILFPQILCTRTHTYRFSKYISLQVQIDNRKPILRIIFRPDLCAPYRKATDYHDGNKIGRYVRGIRFTGTIISAALIYTSTLYYHGSDIMAYKFLHVPSLCSPGYKWGT